VCGPPDAAARQALGQRFGLDLDIDSIPQLAAEHGLRLDGRLPQPVPLLAKVASNSHLPGDAHEQFRALELGPQTAHDQVHAPAKRHGGRAPARIRSEARPLQAGPG